MCLNVGITNLHSASVSFAFYLLCVIKFGVLTKIKLVDELNRDYPDPVTIHPTPDTWTVDILVGYLIVRELRYL